MKKYFVYICVIAIIISSCTQSGSLGLVQIDKAERIDELFTRYTNSGEFSGAVLVVEEDQVLLREGYGFANREEQILNTPETLFSIQSVSKLFTYAAILMEEDQGNLSLDEPLRNYIPDYPNGDEIKIHHLLYHRSGLLHYPHDRPGHTYGSLKDPIEMEELIGELKNFPLKFEPGTEFGYSNAGYSLLAYVIERLSGIPFYAYLQSNIFAPIGMNDTTADLNRIMPDLAVGYEKVSGTFIRSPADHMSYFVGSGAVYSTVDDLYRWYEAIYVDGTMHEFSFGGGNGRGMGYRSTFTPIRSFDISIIILSNYMDAPVTEMVDEVTAILLEDTTLIHLEVDDLDAFVGQFDVQTRFGEITFNIDRVTESLIVTQKGPAGTNQTYEIRPISPNSFVTVDGEKIIGSIFTFLSDQYDEVNQISIDLRGFEFEATRTH